MTRFGSVFAHLGDVVGRSAWLVSGTPADCVNLGIYSLWDDKPDLVVSGINAGLNAGLGFLWSSGTIGAAIEANLAGVPALAVSQALDSVTMSRYAGSYDIDEPTCARFAQQYARFLPGLLKALAAAHTQPEVSDGVVWNMNFPSELSLDAKVCAVGIGETSYRRAFLEEPSEHEGAARVFHHKAELLRRGEGEDTDSGALERGHASLTPILLRGIDGCRRDAQQLATCRTLCESASRP